VIENFVDDYLIFDTRNHPCFTAALLADRHIDVERSLQALRPGHGLVPLLWCFFFIFLVGSALAPLGRCYIDSMFTIGCKNAVEPGQVYSRFRHQGSQLGNEIQRLKDDVRRAITVGRFELIPDIP